ncbi:unnamed protein product, partial [Scytosiphon promiscuus]
VVNRALDRLAAGEIDELPPQIMTFMDQLVSIQSGVPASNAAPPLSSDPALKSLVAALSPQPRNVVITPADVKRIPHLCPSDNVDVNSCLAQFRLVCGFKVKSAHPVTASEEHLERVGDSVAFEFCSLICKDDTLVLYQQLMSGAIDWQAAVVSPENTSSAGSFTPPSTWSELKTALLDYLM